MKITALWLGIVLLFHPRTSKSACFNNQFNVVQLDTLSQCNFNGETVPYSSDSPTQQHRGTVWFQAGSTSIKCAGHLIKTWKNNTAPSGLKAHGITAARCLEELTSSELNSGVIITSLRIAREDEVLNVKATFDMYQDNREFSKRLNATINDVTFLVLNIMDIAVFVLDTPAQKLAQQGYSFYNLGERVLTSADARDVVDGPGQEILGFETIGFNTVDNLDFFLRKSYGPIVNYDTTYNENKRAINAFSHKINMNTLAGALMIKDEDDTIYGLTTKVGPNVNYGIWTAPLSKCFRRTGEFSLNTPNCMVSFKQEYYARTGQIADGTRFIQTLEPAKKTTSFNLKEKILSQTNVEEPIVEIEGQPMLSASQKSLPMGLAIWLVLGLAFIV